MLEEGQRHWACFAGLCFLCAMLRPPYFGSLVTSTVPHSMAMRVVFDAVMIVLGIALIVLSPKLSERRVDERPAVLYALGLLNVIGALVIIVGRFLVADAATLFAVGVLLFGVGFAAIVFGWMLQLARLPRHLIGAFAMAAFALSHVALVLDYLPPAVRAVVSLSYPVMCLVLLHVCHRARLRGEGEGDGAEGGAVGGSAKGAVVGDGADEVAAPALSGLFKRARIFSLALVFSELLCGAFLRSRWAHGGVNYTPTDAIPVAYIVSFAIGLLFLLVVLKVRTATMDALVIGGMGLAGIVFSAASFATLPTAVLHPFVTGLYSALLVCMMFLIALWKSDGDRSGITCAGVFILLYGLLSAITSTIVPRILSFSEMMPDQYLQPVGVVASLVISVGVCAALLITALQKDAISEELAYLDGFSAPKGGSSGSARRDVKRGGEEEAADPWAQLARTYGLTERERETVALMAKGYTMKRVAEELMLAPSTIQAYSKSIYRKMGIHKKDELIEIIEKQTAT